MGNRVVSLVKRYQRKQQLNSVRAMNPVKQWVHENHENIPGDAML